jgi:hypothetical protein
MEEQQNLVGKEEEWSAKDQSRLTRKGPLGVQDDVFFVALLGLFSILQMMLFGQFVVYRLDDSSGAFDHDQQLQYSFYLNVTVMMVVRLLPPLPLTIHTLCVHVWMCVDIHGMCVCVCTYVYTYMPSFIRVTFFPAFAQHACIHRHRRL